MALDNYKGGSNPEADWAVKEEGYRLGRIKGDWEDALHSATPGHSERNWNHGAQMTEELGQTDGNIDSQQEVDAVADWLRNNKPGEPGADGDLNVDENIPEEPKVKASPVLQEAQQRVKAWETDQWSGTYADNLYHDSADTTEAGGGAKGFLDKYKMKLTPGKPNTANLNSGLANQAPPEDMLFTEQATQLR